MTSKNLHIVIIPTWMPIPGNINGIYTRDQADALIAAGNKVSIFMFRYLSFISWIKKKLKREPINNYLPGKLLTVTTYDFVNPFPTRFSTNPIETQKKAFLRFIDRKFAAYIRKYGKPDVIHHHEIADFCYITLHLSKKFNIPYVITEHSPYDPDKGHFNSYETKEERLVMIRQASERIAVSTIYQNHYEKLFGAPFITLPNLVSKEFTEKPLPAFPKPTTPFHFINVGSFLKARRQEILVRAFTAAFKDNFNFQLTIIANGPLEKEIRSLVSVLDMEKQIHLPGPKKKEEVLLAMDQANVLVVSSEMETFSVVAAESLARGNPVLSTRCGGPQDFINDSNGLICNVNDVNDMKEKLLLIYSKYPSFNNKQIAEDAKNNFSEQVVAARLEEVYRKVISLSYPLPGKNNDNQ
jgi:glycosyltransferase involved in cell wall biosynthesis